MNPQGDFGRLFLEELAILKNHRNGRASSWDRRGKNSDWVHLRPGETKILADLKGPGCLKRFYTLALSLDPFFYRNTVVRMFWDDARAPGVNVPLGDFFGIVGCRAETFSSLVLSVIKTASCIHTYSTTCYFPMPFSTAARVELVNESEFPLECFWYHVDYQTYDHLEDEVLRFHASWNRECPTTVEGRSREVRNEWTSEIANLTGAGNYVIMEAEGTGQLAGIVLGVDNIAGGWWGEGDDMVFIDGVAWPPPLHGTGTEEIFGGGASPNEAFSTPYGGFSLVSHRNWSRQNTMYRFFITDPIRFNRSIRYTIEHGHANNCENDYSSVGYWYQREGGRSAPRLPPAKDRIPWLSDAQRPVIERRTDLLRRLYAGMDSIVPQPGHSYTLSRFLNASEMNLGAVLRNTILGAMAASDAAYHRADYETASRELDGSERAIKRLVGRGGG